MSIDQQFGTNRNDRASAAPNRSGRVPPHNLQAEESVLGALLLSRDAIGVVGEAGLNVRDFYSPAHQHIFDSIRSLYSSSGPVDVVTVADELRRHGLLDEIGGIERLNDLQNATPSVSGAEHYARIVMDTALLRRLIHTAGEITDLAFSEPDDVTKAVDLAESKMFEVAEDRVVDSTRPIQELLNDRHGSARGELRARRHDHRRRDRLRRPRRTPLRPAAQHPQHRRRAAGDGKDGLRVGHGDPHREAFGEAGARVLARDGPRRTDAAHPVQRGQGRLDQAAHRQAQRERLVEDRSGRRPARGAAVPRRQPAGHRDGDPGEGPPDQGPARRPRADHDRLPAADERQRQLREPSARGQRDQPKPQDARPRARGADRRAQPAQPKPRGPRPTSARCSPTSASPARSSRTPTS